MENYLERLIETNKKSINGNYLPKRVSAYLQKQTEVLDKVQEMTKDLPDEIRIPYRNRVAAGFYISNNRLLNLL